MPNKDTSVRASLSVCKMDTNPEAFEVPLMRLENLSHHIVYALFPPDALMFIRLFLTPGEVEVPRFSSNTTLGMLRQLKFVH